MAVISTIGATNRPEPDVVELFDHRFTLRRVTRSVQKALDTAEKKLRSLDDNANGDVIVTAMVEQLDAILAPNGKETPAKKVLLDAWKADELSLDQINELNEAVQEASAKAAKRPPTSGPAT